MLTKGTMQPVPHGEITTISVTVPDPSHWQYVQIRRLVLFIEASLLSSLQSVVFEPGDRKSWERLAATVETILQELYCRGELVSNAKISEAYFVQIMEAAELDAGVIAIEVGVAPLKPAEFVIIRIGEWIR